MEETEIIIKVQNDKIFFNPQFSIAIQQTNIPIKSLAFHTNKAIFWIVEILEYITVNKCIRVLVKDYYTSNIIEFDKQEPKKDIEEILFEKFDWVKLEQHLFFYQKSELSEFMFNLDTPLLLTVRQKTSKPEKIAFAKSSIDSICQPIEIKPSVYTITDDFWVDFTDAHFILGYVTFKNHVKELGKGIEFKIPNEHILAEFENIKFWFARRLKTKSFNVAVTITITDNQITETRATSKHIDQITPELIESIKYQRTIALTQKPRVTNIDKSLFTTEDIFAQIDTYDIEGNVFNQSEEDILNFFIKDSNVRNKKQLEYLASKKQSDSNKLRYTLNPIFGFLFLIEGTENNHFVLELLKSHATYIWSIKKDTQSIELQFKRIEDNINIIRTNGREQYKQEYRNNFQKNDIVFQLVTHLDIVTLREDNFFKWKNKLNELLT